MSKKVNKKNIEKLKEYLKKKDEFNAKSGSCKDKDAGTQSQTGEAFRDGVKARLSK
jgi:hypothetical protein